MKNRNESQAASFVGMIAYPGLEVKLMPPSGQFVDWVANGFSRLLNWGI